MTMRQRGKNSENSIINWNEHGQRGVRKVDVDEKKWREKEKFSVDLELVTTISVHIGVHRAHTENEKGKIKNILQS